MPFAKYPPRAQREVERLTRNPEKLANAGGRCWKDSLGRNKSFRTHQPPYPTRRRLVKRPKNSYRKKYGWIMSYRVGSSEGNNSLLLPNEMLV